MELESAAVGAAVGEEPPAADVVDLRQANAELQRRLDEKDVEIAALKERLAALEAASGGGSSGSSSSTDGPGAAAAHIGDYHAIGSRSLPLLSAAHVSRLNTMSNNHGGAPSPSSARQQPQQQQQQAQDQPPLPQQGAGGNANPPEPVHQTDTASIRRRYMALERGEGAKTDLFLLGSAADSLFQSNVGLEFDEDSPSFRRRLRAMDENVEGMRAHLQRLVSVVQRYIEAGAAFAAVGRAFASELMHVQTEAESWFTRLGPLAPALMRFGETFDEIQNNQEAVCASLETTFLAPMRELVKREVQEVKDLKDSVNKAQEEYVAQLKQYLALKRGSPPALVRQRTQELIAVRRRFELGRYDLVNTLNQLESKKKFALVERVVCALYAYLGFFHQGHTELAALEPGMRELQHQLRLSRRAFAQQARVGEARRMQLELLLSAKLTNIQGIKAQLAQDDLSALFEETSLSPSPPAPPTAPSPSLPAGPPAPPSSTPSAPPEQAPGPPLQQEGDDGHGAVLPMAEADRGDSNDTDDDSLLLLAAAAPSHSARHSSTASASSILSYSLPASGPPHSAAGSSPSSPPPLVGYGGRDSRSWSASFSSMAMSPIDRPRATIPAPPSTAHPAHGGQQDGGGGGGGNSAICESGVGMKDVGAGVLLSSPARGARPPSGSAAPDAAGATGVSSTTNTAAAAPSRPAIASVGPNCVKQGYLWKRSSNVLKDWKRRFFFIRNGKLSYQREDDPVGPPRADICDLLLSTVRECPDGPLWTFEILSPGKRPYMLQAENEGAYLEWVHALRSQTEALLRGGSGLGVSPPPSPYRGGQPATGGSASASSHAAFVERVRRANPRCADCGTPGADWAVINAGVVICIQCSGIHRSLGVHVSKVRSLALDRWPCALRLLMDGVGNAQFNAVWEANVPPDRAKPPGPAAGREAREGWIRDKYLGRAFVAQGELGEEEGEGEEDPDAILYNAARRGDVSGVLWALAHGADVHWAHPRRKGRQAVHAVCEGASAAAAAGGVAGVGVLRGWLVCLELLLQNGACLEAVDAEEMSPLDVAMTDAAPPSSQGEGEGEGTAPQLLALNQLSVGSCGNFSLVSFLLSKMEK